MKADERDIRRYFRKKLGFKVNDVILLRDKRTGRHKGCAYVELANLGDVDRVMEASGKIPDFQRFPIMIKASETNKHKRQAVDTDIRIEAQKVYIGNIDQNITQSQLYAIFSQFGELERVLLQVDIATGLSKGYAFLSYHDPKVSNLAIVAMSGQMLGNKAM
jgi:RNA-binding proteins (RRM domain)